MAKRNLLDKAIADLEMKRDVLTLAIDQLKAQRANRPAPRARKARPEPVAEAGR